MSTRKEIHNLYYSISADIDHGECFYSKKYLDKFIDNLDQLKELSLKYFQENQEDSEDEE